MKKVFLVLLCASLFVACGNKKTQEEQAVDTVATEVVAEEPVVEEPVAEEPVAEAAPAKTTTTTSSKKQTVKEHAQAAAENVANAAIDKAESNATETVNNSTTPNKKRR